MTRLLGELSVEARGETYNLHLSMRELATLQDEFGQELKPLVDIAEGGLPHFGILLRVVEVALRRHHPDAGDYTADDILAENPSAAIELVNAAFPTPEEKPSRGKRKAA